MTFKGFRTWTASLCLLGAAMFATAQATDRPLKNEDVIKMVKAGLPQDTIIMTISHSKTAFDSSPDAMILLNQNGVTGPVLNAMLSTKDEGAASRPAPVQLGSHAPCPEKSGVYFNDGVSWRALYQAASAGSEVKPVFGGAKSSVIYIGSSAPVATPAKPMFCFREIKPDLGMTVVRLDQKKDHRELQTSLFSGFLTPGVGSGVKMKNIIHVTSRPVENDEDATIVQPSEPLTPGQYLVLAQNPAFAMMPASVPMSMRVGIGYDFQVK